MCLQPPIELLRQFMDWGGWYARDNAFRTLADVQFVAAQGPPGGGRTFVTDRYLRHFNIVALSQVTNPDCSHTMSSRSLSLVHQPPAQAGCSLAASCVASSRNSGRSVDSCSRQRQLLPYQHCIKSGIMLNHWQEVQRESGSGTVWIVAGFPLQKMRLTSPCQ